MSFTLKQNDTSPALARQLLDADGNPLDVTGASVRFHMTQQIGEPPKVDAPATVITAATGHVQYDWADGDTDTLGNFKGEFEITYADSTVETVPNAGFITVHVKPGVA